MKPNISLLTNQTVLNTLKLSIQERFTRVGENITLHQSTSVNEQWKKFKNEVYEATLNTLGSSRRRRNDWITQRTIDLANSTEAARTNDPTAYRQLRRQTSMSARSDRNEYWHKIAGELEQAAHVGDTRKLYRLIRTQCGSSTTSETIRDLSGVAITNFESRSRRWVEHFESLLNHGDPPSPNQYLDQPGTTGEVYPSNCDPPTKLEIENIIKNLRANKAPGEDGLNPEIFKVCSSVISPWLFQIFTNVWASEEIPQDWREAVLIPFFKKGDKTICANYRGISLIDVACKIFSSLLLNRFLNFRDTRTRPNQAGFRPGRGCVEQIFSLRLILEHRSRYQQPTVTCFVDFAAAFDSIHRPSLWRIMEADGFPPKLLSLIKSFYSHPGNRVLVNGELSDRFETRTGVRQGCPLSPILFNFVIDWILKISVRDFNGVTVGPDTSITDLDYADDICVLANSYTELQHVLDKIDAVSRSVGLKINAGKTKLFSCCIPPEDKLPVQIEGATIEEVESFKYLGSNIRPNGQCVDEILSRINAARKVFFQLRKPLWSRREITLDTKIKVYKSAVRTILLYGCETWPLRQDDERRLSVFDHWCLRYILRVRYFHRITNDEIRRRCFNIPQLVDVIKQNRLRWAGHVLRRPEDEIVNISLRAEPDVGWKRRRGGQIKSWKDKFKSDLQHFTGPTTFGIRRWNRDWLSIASELAEDRLQWKAITRDILGAG
jgi:hypothetical protein